MEDEQIPISKLEVESFGKYISAIYRHVQILIANRLSPYQIGSGQYIFLLTIAKNEGLSQESLSQQLATDKATTAKALKKLETLGYVLRKTSPLDKRYNLLYLTASGKVVVPKVKKILNELKQLSLEGISDVEHKVMLNALQKVFFNIHNLVRSGEEEGM